MFVARHTGFDGLVAAQRDYLDDFWDRADVEVDGDRPGPAGRAVFAVAGAAGRRPDREAGHPGQGADRSWLRRPRLLGHRDVRAAGAHLHPAGGGRRRPGLAPQHACRPPPSGPASSACKAPPFPGGRSTGRSARGTGRPARPPSISTPTWPKRSCTTCGPPGDEEFAARPRVELLVATARLWMSLGHHDPGRGFRIDGVTGPDEYSAIADNNVYTNLMAQRNLRPGRRLADRFPERSARPGRGRRPSASAWQQAAAEMVVPYDEDLGVHPQAEGFTRHDRWNFDATGRGRLPPAAALSLLRPVPQAGGQAARPGHGALRAEATPSPRSRRRGTLPITRR